MLKGLIFDLDGTLTLTQQFHAMAYAEVFSKYGIKYTREDDYAFAGQGGHCIVPETFAKHDRKITPEEEEQIINQKKQVYDRMLAENTIEAVPGIKDFLTRMKTQGLKMAVASGNRLDSIEIILKRVGIRDFFEVIVTNQDVQKSKPAPDIFLKAAEKLGLKPEECIVFEDAINGIQAANAAGIKCIALTTGLPKTELLAAGAKEAVESYNQIKI